MAEKATLQVAANGGSRPVPDPTYLTMVALDKEIGCLRDILEERIHGQKSVFDARLVEMQKAVELLQKIADLQPAEVDTKVSHLERLHGEKFNSVQTQFKERDFRTETNSKQSEVAVGAALQAAKEAVGEQNKSNSLAISKMETAFIKQFDSISELIRTTASGWDRQISDMKERLTRIESEYVGRTKEVAVQQTSSTNTYSLVGLVIGSIVGVGGIVIAILSKMGG